MGSDIIHPHLPWCHFHLNTFCLCDCHLVCWNQSNRWTLLYSQSLLQSHCSAPKNGRKKKKEVCLFKCLNTNHLTALRMQNTLHVIFKMFYFTNCIVFELPLSFFHTLLTNNQNKIKIVTEINLVKKELSHFKNAGDMKLNDASAFFIPITTMNLNSKYWNSCSIPLLITTFGTTLTSIL